MAKRSKPSLPDQREDAVSFNIETAARYVGISAYHMETLCRERKINAFKEGERWIIPRKVLDLYIAERASAVAAERREKAPSDTPKQPVQADPAKPAGASIAWLRDDVFYTNDGIAVSIKPPK